MSKGENLANIHNKKACLTRVLFLSKRENLTGIQKQNGAPARGSDPGNLVLRIRHGSGVLEGFDSGDERLLGLGLDPEARHRYLCLVLRGL